MDEERELSAMFRVENIPTIVLMKNGKVTDTLVGYHPKEQLVAILEKN